MSPSRPPRTGAAAQLSLFRRCTHWACAAQDVALGSPASQPRDACGGARCRAPRTCAPRRPRSSAAGRFFAQGFCRGAPLHARASGRAALARSALSVELTASRRALHPQAALARFCKRQQEGVLATPLGRARRSGSA